VVNVYVGKGTAVSLTGLTIKRGKKVNGWSAGVDISSGSVTMTDCIISDNDAKKVS